FTRIPNKMGRAAIRTVGNLVYAVLNDNPTMSDGTALFDASHNNLASSGAAPSVISMNAGYESMMAQTDRSGNAVALNITPTYGLFPVALRSTALQVLESEHDPAKTSRSANTARNIVMPIIDNRLTGTAWYMAANPSVHDTIEVAYLDGQQAPYLDQQDGWTVDGTEFKVRIDAGVKALAWEGLYKDPGA
ncbi:MAG: Clp protease ClpP, partial [Pseudomonadota bacterium]